MSFNQAARATRARFYQRHAPGVTIAQHVVHLDAIVDHLRQSLGQDKIIVMGHSWGAALGLLYAQAHPDKVSAFVGVNPVVSTREGQQAEYDFVLAEASRRKDNGALAHLRKIGPPPYKKVGQVLAMEKLVQRYGGVFHKEPRRTWIMVRAIFSGLVTPWEIARLIHANNLSLEAMNEELLGLGLAGSVPSASVPVMFFLGRHDRHTDGKLAATYFGTLCAPVKRCNANDCQPVPESKRKQVCMSCPQFSVGVRSSM